MVPFASARRQEKICERANRQQPKEFGHEAAHFAGAGKS
jgi:hypothetical protein